jgi:hypothetical protein
VLPPEARQLFLSSLTFEEQHAALLAEKKALETELAEEKLGRRFVGSWSRLDKRARQDPRLARIQELGERLQRVNSDLGPLQHARRRAQDGAYGETFMNLARCRLPSKVFGDLLHEVDSLIRQARSAEEP